MIHKFTWSAISSAFEINSCEISILFYLKIKKYPYTYIYTRARTQVILIETSRQRQKRRREGENWRNTEQITLPLSTIV